MASNIPDLTAIAGLAAGDVFYVVDDPTGTPIDRKATLSQVRQFAHRQFDTRDYGTVGDGGTDDTAAIQAAIDACEAAGGGEVCFPAGIHRLTSVTVDTDKVRLVGSGVHSTILQATAGHTGNLVTINADYCGVRDMTIDANDLGDNALYIYEASRSEFENLYVLDAGAAGIHIEGESDDTAHANWFTNIRVLSCVGQGVYVAGAYAYDNQFIGLWVGTCGDHGVEVESGNTFFNSLHSWGNTGDGLHINGANYCRIVNAYLETNGGNGATVNDSRSSTLVAANLWKNTGTGATLSGTSIKCRVTASNAYDNGGSGVQVASGADDTIISACSMWDYQGTKTQDYGIQIDSGANDALVVGCNSQAGEHATGAFTDSGTNTRTVGNVGFVAGSAYSVTNVSTDRAYDANSTDVAELADALGTLIADLRQKGIVP